MKKFFETPKILLVIIIGLTAACTPAETASPPTPMATARPTPVIPTGTVMPRNDIPTATAAPATAVMPIPTTTPVPVAVSDTHTTIAWTDNNQPGQTFSLFYDTDDRNFDGTLIVADIPAADPANQFEWYTAAVPDGTYFVYAAVDDGAQVSNFYIAGPIAVRHDTTCFSPTGRENVLSNGSFESGFLAPAGWKIKKPAFTRERAWDFGWENDPARAHDGSRAIRIGGVVNGVHSDSAWKDRVIVESDMRDLPVPGGKYLLTAWVRTENVAAGHVMFRLKYYDADGAQLSLAGHGTDTFFAGDGVSEGWRQVAFLVDTPHWDAPPYPANARAAKITVSVSLDNSPGTLWVDDISLVALTEAEFERLDPANRYRPPALASADAPPELPAPPPGWGASVARDATGAWWLVGADGSAFWATGVNTSANEKLLAAVGLSAETYRKTAQAMARSALNFNANWRTATANGFSPAENYIQWLNFSTETDISAPEDVWVMKDRDGNLLGDYPHYFPDVFSVAWQENARNEAKKLLEHDGEALTNPRVLGYWTDNEWAYGDLYDFLWGDTAQLAFADWLQGENDLPSVDARFAAAGSTINLDVPPGFEHPAPYRTVENLNRAWSSPYHTYRYQSFRDVFGADKPYLRGHDDPVKADLFAFERVIYKIYVDTIVDNIRRVEDDFIARTGQGMRHLIFSNRFDVERPAALDALRRNMDIFSRFDVIALNWYPDFNRSRTFQPRAWMEMVQATFFTPTQRPLYIAEFGLAAEDAAVPVMRWRPKTVAHQYQRGWAYANLVSTWANLPYVIGANWYQWANGYGDAGDDPRNSGLVDDAGNFYVPLTDVMRSVNGQVNRLARSGAFSPDDIDWGAVEIDLCESVAGSG